VLHLFRGDHLFIHSAEPQFLRALNGELGRLVLKLAQDSPS
jgi:hypothetical protein